MNAMNQTAERVAVIAAIAVLLAASAAVHGQSGGGFEITKSTIDGGGGLSAGGDFVLTGTIGQPEAGAQTASGNEFALAGGFWAQIGNLVIELIFEDGFE